MTNANAVGYPTKCDWNTLQDTRIMDVLDYQCVRNTRQDEAAAIAIYLAVEFEHIRQKVKRDA